MLWWLLLGVYCVPPLLQPVLGLDNGLALTPPLGWRTYNAFGGDVSQDLMEEMMEAMVDRSRMVDGKPTSLLDLGYKRAGLDGGWEGCGLGVNGSQHTIDGTPIPNAKFPDLKGMVAKGHALGLLVGHYMNHCGCAEWMFTNETIPTLETVMRGSVKALIDQGWDGLKEDSCSEFNNLTWWSQLINESKAQPIMIENCHQGGFVPGMTQWQSYAKNSSTGDYTHKLGYFRIGDDMDPPVPNISYAACKSRCDANASCKGFCFESDSPKPSGLLPRCITKVSLHFDSMDLSQSSHCRGDGSNREGGVSDCPFSMFRTSGDIYHTWQAMLSNLGTIVAFSDESVPLSRPGGWA